MSARPGDLVRVIILERDGASTNGRAVLPDGTPLVVADAASVVGQQVSVRVVTVVSGPTPFALGRLEGPGGAALEQ